MHILLVNDDGIHASGIRALCDAVTAAGHRVSICAPDRERSAASHAATLSAPLHAKPVDFPGAHRAWAADGTPSDCARLGLFLLRDDPADMVISGINHGSNLGGACIYSGTVGAAMEASMANVPALATSLCVQPGLPVEPGEFAAAARISVIVAEWMAHQPPLPRGAVYNLNVPLLPYERIRGVVPATLGPQFLDDALYRIGEDATGECYYYLTGESPPMDDPDFDVVKTEKGYATVTKLTWDIRLHTDHSDINTIRL